MANLTIAIDDELLRAARIKAVAEGTSVNEVCRRAIERYARPEVDDIDARIATLRAIARKTKASPAGEPIWPGREAFYEEVLRERGLLGPRPDSGPVPKPAKASRRR